jgi:acyl phosphate:glycerol-3-phosphate acyltransferase
LLKNPLFDSILAVFVPLLLLAALGGYLIGSVPWAYLLVRWRAGLDLRREGSGNIGTLNSLVVSRSRHVALAVLILDVAKGYAAVAWGGWVGTGDFTACAVAGLSAVVGHNYPIWLRFAGGRGLAPGAGVMLGIAWPVVPVWMLLWGIGFLLVRSVNPANALASVLLAIAALLVPDAWMGMVPQVSPALGFRLLVVTVMGAILTRLVAPVREYVSQLRDRRSRREGR